MLVILNSIVILPHVAACAFANFARESKEDNTVGVTLANDFRGQALSEQTNGLK